MKIGLKLILGFLVVAVVSTVFFATGLGLFISYSISKPIQELTKASAALKKGNLNYRVKIKSKDEIGDLAKTFNQMRRRLKRAESIAVKDRNQLLGSLLKTFKGKFGNLAVILMRKDIQNLIKRNPRIMNIIPKEMAQIIKKGEELKKEVRENKDVKKNIKKEDK